MPRLACGLRLASGLFLSLAFLSATAPAQTWNGGGADNNWNTAGNWSGGVPSNNGTANVFFGGTLRLAPVVNANNPWSINSLTFNFLAAANAFTISGNALTIGTGGITNNDTDANTINDAINTNGLQSWNAAFGDLVFGGTVTISGINVLSVSGSHNATFNGSVTGNSLVNFGAGTLTLGGSANNVGLAVSANSGTTVLGKASSASVHAVNAGLTIGGGTVQLGGSGGDQILDAAPVTINSGTFDLEGTNETIGALNGGAAGVITNIGFLSTNTLTVSGGGTFAGVIQNGSIFDTTALNVTGSTPLILTGASTYTAGTTIGSTGILQLGNGTTANGSVAGNITDNGQLRFANPNVQTFGGAITGTGSLTKTGAGNLTLNGGPSSFTGGTTINGGAVLVPSGGSLTSQGNIFIGTTNVAGQSGTLSVDGTGTVVQSGSNYVNVGGVGFTTGTLNIGNTINGATFTTGTSGMQINPLGTVNVGTGAVTGTLTCNGDAYLNGGVLQTGSSGNVFTLASGQNMQVFFGGRASFTGNYSTNNGTYSVGGNNGPTFSKLETLGGGDLSVVNGGTISVTVGGLLSSAGGLSVGTSGNGTVVVDGSGSKLTVASFSTIGLSGFTGSVTFQNGSTGNVFHDVALANSSFDGSTGSMSVLSGSTATIGNLNLLFSTNQNSNFGQSATFTVDGTGSSVTLTPGANVSVGEDSPNLGTLTASNNGVFTVGAGGTTTLNPTGTININGGIADLKTLIRNGGTLNFTAGSLSFIGSFNVGLGGLLGPSLTLDASKSLTLTGTTTIDAFKTLTLSGGTLNTGNLVNNGAFVFTSGTLGITGAGGLTIGAGGALGSSYTLPAGTNLNVANTTTVNSGAALDVNGGNFSTGALNNSGLFAIDAGSATVSGALTNNASALLYVGQNKIATVNGASSNAGDIQLGGALALLNGAGTLANTGLLHGDGVIANSVTNNFGGEIRAESGKRLKFTGTNGANAGKINLQGGTAEFSRPLTNTGNGLIAGRGTLIVGGTGLVNQANVALSSGITDVFGDVNNSTGVGTTGITVSGNANVTFWDDVTNGAGSLFKVSTGSSATFFGTYGGAGITGGGQVNFEADVTPGFSPAAVTFGGNLTFDSTSTLHLDFGGTTPGNGPHNHDQVNVVGTAALGGSLDLIQYNGFVPVSGDKFVVMTYASETGTFAAATGTTPAPGLTYSTVYLPNSLVIVTTTNGDKTWGVDSSGNASLGSNWLGGVAPGGIGDSAAFATIITANRMVTLDADTTVGTLKFDSPNNYTIAGPHMLTLQAAGATAATINVSGAHGNGAHTISAPITLASDLNITQNSGGTFTLSGALNDAAAHAITQSGSGTTEIDGPPTFGPNTMLTVNSGTLRFGLTTGAAAIGSGVQATVNASATLELAGSVSALSSGANRVHVVNNNPGAPGPAGLLVSGTHQQVGNIDGSGTTQVNAGSDLTANHIIQSALIIGGTAGSPGLATIDASDASGNPLASQGNTSTGFIIAISVVPTDPFAGGMIDSTNPINATVGQSPSISAGSPAIGSSSVGNVAAAVPEPTAGVLALLGFCGLASAARRKRAPGA